MISECPLPDPECKYFGGPDGCHSSTHHLYWPRRDYTTKTARQFRELPAHKEQLCRREHDERHATEQPPTKPSHTEMLRAIASQAIREMGYESQMDGS